MQLSPLRRRLGVAYLTGLVAFLAFVVVEIGGASSAPAQAAPRPGLPTPQFGADIPVIPSPSPSTTKEKNLSMAVNSTNPNQMLGAFEYSDINAGFGSGYSRSTDAGRSWISRWFLGPWSQGVAPQGNPNVAYDAHGVAYYTTQVASNDLNGYMVLTSTNGVDWNTPAPVAVTDWSEYRDQSDLAVDKRTTGPDAGSAYLIWRWFTTDNVGVQFTASRDKGATWSPQVQVSDATNSYAYGPRLAIATNGKIYASFEELDNACICNPPKLYLDSSTDGGRTWGTDRLISGSPVVAAGSPDVKGRELILLGDPKGGGVRINHYPTIAVSPLDPNLVYAAWNDGRWDTEFPYFQYTGKHSDIAFSRSTDGGLTWSAAMRVNDDPQGNGVDQWQPQLAVVPDGTLGLSFFDRRNDPSGYLFDTYYTQSTDGGLTWSPDARVSDVSSNPMAAPDAKGIGDLGYRTSLVFGPDAVLPGWLDSRRGLALDFYTDRGVVATPTVTPTATSTPTPTATGTPCSINFSDVHPTDYFYVPVEYLYCHGAISGYADGTFRPYNNTTRGQLSKIVVLAEGWPIDTSGGPHFTDVPADSPFYAYIETAYNRGVISGYADNTFRPGNNVTRAQLSKIVVNSEGWPIDTTGGPHFTDVPQTDPFYGFIETAFNHGIISGYADNTFRPGANATRGQISKIVYGAITQP